MNPFEVSIGLAQALTIGAALAVPTAAQFSPATITKYGSGCTTSQLKVLDATADLPAIGIPSMCLQLNNAVPSGSAALILATSRVIPPLLLPSTPNCYLHVVPVVTVALLANASGIAGLCFANVINPGLTGVVFHSQWAILDPGANPLGLVSSNGVEHAVGWGPVTILNVAPLNPGRDELITILGTGFDSKADNNYVRAIDARGGITLMRPLTINVIPGNQQVLTARVVDVPTLPDTAIVEVWRGLGKTFQLPATLNLSASLDGWSNVSQVGPGGTGPKLPCLTCTGPFKPKPDPDPKPDDKVRTFKFTSYPKLCAATVLNPWWPGNTGSYPKDTVITVSVSSSIADCVTTAPQFSLYASVKVNPSPLAASAIIASLAQSLQAQIVKDPLKIYEIKCQWGGGGTMTFAPYKANCNFKGFSGTITVVRP